MQRGQLAAVSNSPQFQQAVDELFSKLSSKQGVDYDARYVPYFGIAGLLLVGVDPDGRAGRV